MWGGMREFVHHQTGSIATVFALALVPILGGLGVALDYSRASSSRSSIQNAIDAAVLGGIMKDKGERIAAAREIFKANLPPSLSAATADFSNVDDITLTGTASYTVRTQISRFIGASDTLPTTAKATARFDAATPPPPGEPGGTGDVCVLVLDPSGSQSLLVNSGARLNAPTCEVHVKSKASPAAIFNSGSDLKAKRFCLEGSDVIQNSTNVKNLELRCKTANDPFASGLPAPPSTACPPGGGQNYSGTFTLSPGVYCGWHNFNSPSNVTFLPGVYLI
ncbi:MAG: TadE/TadG family type IV pilus assembly protein, partial [Beijerinckiaceae bacterium]